MKTLKSWLRWSVINGAFAVAVYFAAATNNENLCATVRFAAIALTVVSWVFVPIVLMVAVMATDETKRKMPKKITAVTGWFDALYDCGIVLAFAYLGWTCTAAIYFSHIFACAFMRALIEGMANEKAK